MAASGRRALHHILKTGNRLQSCLFVANQSNMARNPIGVYQPGDKIPTGRNRGIKTKYRQEIEKEIVLSKPIDAANRATDTFKEVMADAVQSSKRNMIVLEGQRLIEEGFKAGLQNTYLFLQKNIKNVPERLAGYVRDQNVHVLQVSQHAFKTWSTLTTPPGIVGLFLKPKPDEIAKRSAITAGIPVTVICDNVREPGNLGSILRDAAAAGCKRILLSKGCVDPWDPKTLRVGCGAHFYIPIVTDYPLHTIETCMEIESRGGSIAEMMESAEKENDALSKAGESDESSSDRCTTKKSGPSRESSSEVTRSTFALFLADSNNTETNGRKSVPVHSYTDVDYTKIENVYLVVGGETEGLSSGILKMSENLQNVRSSHITTTAARLQIPVCRQIESLNASHAFAIISFEILRQYRLKTHPQLQKSRNTH